MVDASEDPQTDGPIDVEAMIAEFLRDNTRSSFELPRSLSTQQRKQARRLADQHPGLKCESFGFGAERQLHLFKKDAGRSSASGDIGTIGQDRPATAGQEKSSVRVKNTFIDDWVAPEGGEPATEEAMLFRSMPVALLERTLNRCMEVGDGTLDVQGLARTEESSVPSGAASPRSSTTAGPDAGQLVNSPGSSGPDLPPLPEGFQVRNTFIHIESVPVVERIVQSMPNGMFRQCLEAELSAQKPISNGVEADGSEARPNEGVPGAPTASAIPSTLPRAPAVAPPTVVTPATVIEELSPGTEVVIQGLVKLPDFNGLSGVIQSLDMESGRYDVLLNAPAGSCGWKWVKVRGENCRPTMPPPPRNAPTLVLEEESATENQPVEGETPGSAAARSGSFAIPATPKWEEDYSLQASSESKANATPLNLNALV